MAARVILLKGFVTPLLKTHLRVKINPYHDLTELYIVRLQVIAFILLPTNLPLVPLAGPMLCLKLEIH